MTGIEEPSSTPTSRVITHVIFDLDGLLLNTEIFYTQILMEYAARFGKEFTWELKQQQMGRKEHESAQLAIDYLGLPITAEEYCRHVREELTRLLPTSQFLPGAVKLVSHLHRHGIPLAIATGSDSFTFKKKTMNHGDFLLMFTHWVLSGDDPMVRSGKPAPDIFLVCNDRFKDPPKPENVLVFEDALNGVTAGVAAGMPVVAVPDERANWEDFRHAAVILKSLLDFKPEDFGLPPYDHHSHH
ncbi:Pseudouridine-5'-phosphatase [Hypsibius exemplaris]|uniref:pseudouridine 5'-phosphatase n=1 Tax=Hypsibius exemplaris TaxID=2072580 RepID=A0A9X6RLJ5_HYPEX|nr:Pseudouridine-5'-phosphatase [Hypsibius exemplaris]